MNNFIDFKLLSAQESALELGRRLRAVRLAQDMRQEELAKRAGVSRLTIAHFEKTGRGSVDSFLRMALALGYIAQFSNLLQSSSITIEEMEKNAVSKRLRASRKT